MPSPFPGVDPYIEAQGLWPDFHTEFLSNCRNSLNEVLPENYAALIEELVCLVDEAGNSVRKLRSDIAIDRAEGPPAPPRDEGGVAVMEPVTLPLAMEDPEQVLDRWIEIRRLPEQTLVTVIELLSPFNKRAEGRVEYLKKRKELLRQPINLVEIDLLLNSRPLPMGAPMPRGDYFAIVARADRTGRRCVFLVDPPAAAGDPDPAACA